MFTGGSQFALIGVLAGAGPIPTVAVGTAAITSAGLLGVRNALYSMRMAPIVGGPWWRKLGAAHLTIDESTAVATAQPTLHAQRVGFWATGLAIYIGWNVTTLVGALLGNLVGDVRVYGLDAAAAAAFLGLLWPRLTALQPIAVAAGAAVVAALLLPFAPSGVPVLAAAGVGVVVGLTNWLGSATRRGSSA
jgi:predicted branched-subunit amino acid permease